MILHIPHASTYIPPEIGAGFLLDEEELKQELILMTDAFTDELFNLSEPHLRVEYPVSRMVCDPERFLDDDSEPMSRVGMGVVYTRTCDGRELRAGFANGERKKLIDRFYAPHHQKLEKAVEIALDTKGRALIVDCHSFPSKPLPYEQDQSLDRPDICIGMDPFHTPLALIDRLYDTFGTRGFTVELDRPFSGTIVPVKHFRKNRKVQSVMIEINRKLYMDEETGDRSDDFAEFSEIFQHCLKEISL